MPDNPTKRPVPFHVLMAWCTRQILGRRARPKVVPTDDAARLMAAVADAAYEGALDGVVEITGEIFPRGLIDTGPAVIAPEVIETCRPELVETVEFPGLTPRTGLILTPRWPGGLAQYRKLRFRLARPAAFAEYLAGKPRRLPRIPDNVLLRLLLEDPIFQWHRDKKRLPKMSLLRDVAELRYPEYAVPGDNRLRSALGLVPRARRVDQAPDPRIVAMYGKTQTGPPPTWERDLFNFAKIDHRP
jgi:hypothetical protein